MQVLSIEKKDRMWTVELNPALGQIFIFNLPGYGFCSVYVTLCACSKSELGGGNVRKRQKYTYSQHGNKCFKEEIRSLSKVGFVSKDKASFVRKDTTGT